MGDKRAVRQEQQQDAKKKRSLKKKIILFISNELFRLSPFIYPKAARTNAAVASVYILLAILMMIPIMPMMIMIKTMSRQILSPARTFSMVSLSYKCGIAIER